MSLLIDDVIDHIEFKNPDGSGTDAFFLVHHEFPYIGWLEYMNILMTLQVDPQTGTAVPGQSNSVSAAQLVEILIKYGLVGFDKVVSTDGTPLTKADYVKLPFQFLSQVVAALQERNQNLNRPNA
jgi:hypothetical protein